MQATVRPTGMPALWGQHRRVPAPSAGGLFVGTPRLRPWAEAAGGPPGAVALPAFAAPPRGGCPGRSSQNAVLGPSSLPGSRLGAAQPWASSPEPRVGSDGHAQGSGGGARPAELRGQPSRCPGQPCHSRSKGPRLPPTPDTARSSATLSPAAGTHGSPRGLRSSRLSSRSVLSPCPLLGLLPRVLQGFLQHTWPPCPAGPSDILSTPALWHRPRGDSVSVSVSSSGLNTPPLRSNTHREQRPRRPRRPSGASALPATRVRRGRAGFPGRLTLRQGLHLGCGFTLVSVGAAGQLPWSVGKPHAAPSVCVSAPSPPRGGA